MNEQPAAPGPAPGDHASSTDRDRASSVGSAHASAGDVRPLLRRLRVWEGTLPSFDPATAPDDPLSLFVTWLGEAADAGVAEPHVMTLATADERGTPSARIVVLHDADAHGWHFASHRTSRKGRDLEMHPEAALCFYWPAVGRQVRVAGPVRQADPEESAADLHGRSPAALAAALVGHQSEPLGSREELARAGRAARERAVNEPDAPVPSWTLYALRPAEVEFFQGDPDRQHVRLLYRRTSAGWERGLLWP